MFMFRLPAATVIVMGLAAAPAFAQKPCLHDANETPEQAQRRQQALGAARMVNTMQANQPGAPTKVFFTHDQLETAPYLAAARTKGTVQPMNFKPGAEILPGWKLTLDTTREGYWFIIKDTTDPCGFSWISNQDGLIYKAEHLR
jgi:hypothetical protein